MAFSYAHQFVRLTWGGTFDGEEEIWTNNLSIINPDADLPFALTTVPTSIVTVIQTWHENGDAGITSRAKLAWIKLAAIKTDGTYVDEAVLYDFPAPIAGGSLGSVETTRSLAVSFKTSYVRGKAANGRFYIPGFNEAVGTNGRLTGTTQGNVLGAAQAFLVDLNVAVGTDISPDAVIGVTSYAETGARSARIDEVRIGDVIDGQRRRKNKMLENYVSSSV